MGDWIYLLRSSESKKNIKKTNLDSFTGNGISHAPQRTGWECHANCGRLLSRLHIRDRMLLFFDSTEWKPDVDICVFVCVYVFLTSLCGKNLTSIPYQQNHPAFSFFCPLFLIMFCLLPLKLLHSPLSFYSSTDPFWPGCSMSPCILLRCLSFQHLPEFSPESGCFVWRGKRKQQCWRHPPQAAQMDHRGFHLDQRDVTHANLKVFTYSTVCKIMCCENIVSRLLRRLSPGWIIQKHKVYTNTLESNAVKSKGQFSLRETDVWVFVSWLFEK